MSIKQISDNRQGAINAYAQEVVKESYDPVTNSALGFIEKGTNLISKKDTFTQKFSSYQPIKDAKGLIGKVKAVANYCDVKAKKLDGVSIEAGEKAYEVSKHFLNFITGTFISRSKFTRSIQEGISTLVGGAVRGAIKVVEYCMRIIPYLAIIPVALSGMAIALTPIGVAIWLVVMQRKFNGLTEEINEIKNNKKQNPSKSEKNHVIELLGKHKGKVAAAAITAAAAAGAYIYGVPTIVSEAFAKVAAQIAKNGMCPVNAIASGSAALVPVNAST